MFKEILLNEKVYRNEKPTKWSLPDEVQRKITREGLQIIGIGLLEKFAKNNQDSEFVFTSLLKNERQKGQDFKNSNPNPGEILCRYTSNRTAIAGESHLCILNADKGYMRFMENIDSDPDIEDAKWSKPQKFRYLRTTF